MTTVKILGSGCAKCKALHQRLLDLRTEHGLEFDLIKVTELREIMSYGIMATPGLVVNDVVKSTGVLPDATQILEWLKEAHHAA
ncbi:hypothetical protein BAC2_03053 [uncultured bacterium]|nr:hypothetical protein BAC2_03053 [uncultured bacterium]